MRHTDPTSPTADRAGVAHSLLLAAQRRELTALGEAAGTRVLFLKAAWADPVLYGGTGQRQGGDLDVLIAPERFVAFAKLLRQAGYEPLHTATHPVYERAQKESVFFGGEQRLPLDVHRGLVEEPWFAWPVERSIDDAVAYASPDGPVLSLCPSDQVLYAAAHYANHALQLDARHLRDIQRLLGPRSAWRDQVNWRDVNQHAHAAGLEIALGFVVRELSHLEPTLDLRVAPLRGRAAKRLAAAEVIMRAHVSARLDNYQRALVHTLLSNRPTALPRFLARYVGLRTGDLAVRATRRLLESAEP